jgi:hypothetical protein
MIIETSDNRFFRVEPTANADMDHLWHGLQVKKVRGEWVNKSPAKKPHWVLVRKVATNVIEA